MQNLIKNIIMNKTIKSSEILEALRSIDESIQKTTFDNEDLANDAWRIKSSIELKWQYVTAFEKMKAQEHYDAWYLLERAEITLKFLKENSSELFQQEFKLWFYEHYITQWQSLFPYQIFFSPGMIVGYYTCSICGAILKPKSRCSHKKGKLYNGQICLHEGHDLELLEISMVKDPVQKYSIPLIDYDYRLINCVINNLEHPYEGWGKIESTQTFPRENFIRVNKDDDCPCKITGKKFGDCCSEKGTITIPHITFVFDKKLSPDQEIDYFPYRNQV